MEKRRKTHHIYIFMAFEITAEAFQRMCSCRRLTYIKSDLRLYILPVVYHCIVHMYRIPHDVCKKTYCIFVKFLRRLDHDISTLRIVRPVFCFYGLTCRTVNHFPPSVNIVSCIDCKHVRIQVIHQMNFKFFFYCCMERSHNINSVPSQSRIASAPHSPIISSVSLITSRSVGIVTRPFSAAIFISSPSEPSGIFTYFRYL